MLTGWATGNFGLFGIEEVNEKFPGYNYGGLALVLVSLMLFSCVDVNEPSSKDVSPDTYVALEKNEKKDEDPLKSPFQRNLGFAMALMAGMFYGTNFDPPTVLMQEGGVHSKDPMDYVFSHFCGIWFTSLVCLVGYKIKNGGEAYHPLNIVLPSMLSGIGWGIAQVAWFKANAALSYVIAFPIICTCPGYLSVFWGILIFKELQGKRARILTLAALCFQVPGVIFVALSRG